MPLSAKKRYGRQFYLTPTKFAIESVRSFSRSHSSLFMQTAFVESLVPRRPRCIMRRDFSLETPHLFPRQLSCMAHAICVWEDQITNCNVIQGVPAAKHRLLYTWCAYKYFIYYPYMTTVTSYDISKSQGLLLWTARWCFC